jgi:hypothetical protein
VIVVEAACGPPEIVLIATLSSEIIPYAELNLPLGDLFEDIEHLSRLAGTTVRSTPTVRLGDRRERSGPSHRESGGTTCSTRAIALSTKTPVGSPAAVR